MLLEKWAIAITRILRKMHLPLAPLTYINWNYLHAIQMIIFSAVTLQRMASTAWGYGHTLIYVRGTLGISLVVPNTLTYVSVRCIIRRGQLIFWTCLKLFSVCERKTYMLRRHLPYAKHLLDALDNRLIR